MRRGYFTFEMMFQVMLFIAKTHVASNIVGFARIFAPLVCRHGRPTIMCALVRRRRGHRRYKQHIVSGNIHAINKSHVHPYVKQRSTETNLSCTFLLS